MAEAVDPKPAFLALPVLAGAALRLAGLTRQPLWVDEIITLKAASVGEPFRFADVLANPQGPLPHLLLRLWLPLAGSGDLSLRLWSALASILALALAAAAFRKLAPRAAVLGTWLLALSPFQIWYAHEVRNYAFLTAAAVAALWTLGRALERSSPGRWAAHAAALAAMLLCNLSALFVLPAVGLALLLTRPRRLAGWVPAAAAAVLIASPWILESVTGHMDWNAVSGGVTEHAPIRGGRAFVPAAVPFTYASFVGGFGIGPPLRLLHETGGGGVAWGRYLPALAAGLLGAGGCLAYAARRRWDVSAAVLWAWSFLPVLFAAAVALAGLKAFNPRYLAASQPLFLLLLAVGGTAALGRNRVRGAVLIALLAAAMAVGGWRQAFDPDYGKEDFRGAAAFLREHAAPGDVILEQGVSGPLERYYRGPVPVRTFFAVFFNEAEGGRQRLRSLIGDAGRVWWVGSRLWYEDPETRVLGWLEADSAPGPAWSGPGVEVRGFRVAEEVR